MKTLLLFIVTALVLMSACNNTASVDLIVHGGTIHSMDSNLNVYNALAVKDGMIVALGTDDEIMGAYNAPNLLNLKGKHVFPGLIDAHCHLYGLGEQTMIVDLIGTEDAADVISRVKAFYSNDLEWIRGRGWDQNDWPVKEFPTREMLDAAFPDTPVFLVRVDGHAVWVNSKAIEIAGVTAATPDPVGGRILKKDGEPTGILIDNAIEIIRDHIPSPDVNHYKQGYAAAIDQCLSYGLTGVHDMGLNANQIKALQELIAEDALPFRITGYVDGLGEAWENLCRSDERIFGNDQLVLAGLKLYADGALGSRGALLLEPYSDDPGNRGVQIITENALTEETVRALDADLQVCVHAIGDSAVRLVLNAYERALQQTEHHGIPLRIEHTQVIAPEDLSRFAALGIIPSMQPTHCTSDMYWAEARLGPERVEHSYPWRSLVESGCILPFGSDFPVEHPDPLAGIYAACTRQDKQGRPASAADIAKYFTLANASTASKSRYENGWYSSEKLSQTDAIKGFTQWAAGASTTGGNTAKQGSLAPMHYADFIITEIDLETCPPEDLLSQPVIATYVDGKEVYHK